MPDFAAWLEAETAGAREAWKRIEERAVGIMIRRGAEMLDAQVVRIEIGNSTREDLSVRQGLNMMPGVQQAVVFGVRGHPMIADTDIRRGDRFVIGATEYEVIGVSEAAGEVQAVCEGRT